MSTLALSERITAAVTAYPGQTDFETDFPALPTDGPYEGLFVRIIGGTVDDVDLSGFTVVSPSPSGFIARLTTPCVGGERVFVYGLLPAERDIALTPGGAVQTPVLEADAMNVQGQLQEARRDLGRTISAPLGEAPKLLPAASQRALKAFFFDAAGDPLMATPPAQPYNYSLDLADSLVWDEQSFSGTIGQGTNIVSGHAFGAADVGKMIQVRAAGPRAAQIGLSHLYATITGWSVFGAILSASASVAAAGTLCFFGTDNGPAMTTAFAVAAANGEQLHCSGRPGKTASYSGCTLPSTIIPGGGNAWDVYDAFSFMGDGPGLVQLHYYGVGKLHAMAHSTMRTTTDRVQRGRVEIGGFTHIGPGDFGNLVKGLGVDNCTMPVFDRIHSYSWTGDSSDAEPEGGADIEIAAHGVGGSYGGLIKSTVLTGMAGPYQADGGWLLEDLERFGSHTAFHLRGDYQANGKVNDVVIMGRCQNYKRCGVSTRGSSPTNGPSYVVGGVTKTTLGSSINYQLVDMQLISQGGDRFEGSTTTGLISAADTTHIVLGPTNNAPAKLVGHRIIVLSTVDDRPYAAYINAAVASGPNVALTLDRPLSAGAATAGAMYFVGYADNWARANYPPLLTCHGLLHANYSSATCTNCYFERGVCIVRTANASNLLSVISPDPNVVPAGVHYASLDGRQWLPKSLICPTWNFGQGVSATFATEGMYLGDLDAPHNLKFIGLGRQNLTGGVMQIGGCYKRLNTNNAALTNSVAYTAPTNGLRHEVPVHVSRSTIDGVDNDQTNQANEWCTVARVGDHVPFWINNACTIGDFVVPGAGNLWVTVNLAYVLAHPEVIWQIRGVVLETFAGAGPNFCKCDVM